jgi:hypothetical protein
MGLSSCMAPTGGMPPFMTCHHLSITVDDAVDSLPVVNCPVSNYPESQEATNNYGGGAHGGSLGMVGGDEEKEMGASGHGVSIKNPGQYGP